MKPYLNLLRLYQWPKNGFVFVGFFALGDYRNAGLFVAAVIATAAFCLASSSVYIFNDYLDMPQDRLHPQKKQRPLASGAIKPLPALVLSGALAAASLILAAQIGWFSIAIILAYFANNLAYSLYLKRQSILDVFSIALGFMLRIFAGTLGIGIAVSEWLVLTGFMLSLLIGFSKRYAEVSNYVEPENHRWVLQRYSAELLRIFIVIMATASMITYALYTVSSRAQMVHGTTRLIYTTPFVMLGIFRYLQLIFLDRHGEDPAMLVSRDRPLLGVGILWALSYILLS